MKKIRGRGDNKLNDNNLTQRKSAIDTTEGSDDRGKLVQPTNGHDIVSGHWTYEGSFMSDDALVKVLNSAGDTMDGSGRRN